MTAIDGVNDIKIIEEGIEIAAYHGTKLERLEAESDIVADYLEELLNIVDLDGDIEIDVEDGRVLAEIATDGEPDRCPYRLVGHHGEIPEPLQELTRLAVQTQTGERSQSMLDVIGRRVDRRDKLQALMEQKAVQVRDTGEPMRFAPMNPSERRAYHGATAVPGLYSESEEMAPNRYMMLSLDETDSDDADHEAIDAESDS